MAQMDVFNRTPAISEDTIQYTLYPRPELSDKASVTTFAACIHSYVDSLLPDFIWHRDAFQLKVVSDPDSEGWMLEGRTRVGDCVDDEWCTVWLLKEVSSKWDIVINVFDSDGQFILIEAAEALPAWVTPTNSENRVWIYSSHLHLIPISHASPPYRKRSRRNLPGVKESDNEEDGNIDDDHVGFITVEHALRIIRDATIPTMAPPSVEKTVWQRISGYPAAAQRHIHITKAYIPVDIARALSVNPSLVQKPVETFYTRDAIQLRAAHRMTQFPPEPSVLTIIKMSRTAYAQLVGQKFFPPKVFGQWQEKEGTTEWRWRDVGMKIASGFEMLYQESKGRTDISSSSPEAIRSSIEAKKVALRRDPEYNKYMQSLISADYFRGEIEDSQLWTALEDKAATTFVEVRREDDATRQSFAALVASAISQAASIALFHTQDKEEPDDWLNINARDFDNMLEQTMGVSKNKSRSGLNAMDVDNSESEQTSKDRLAAEQASKLQNLAAKVEEFVEGEGDLEGATFEDDEFSDEVFSDDVMSSDSDNDNEQEKMAARQTAMDNLVPGITTSEYGEMPASFHNNSQKVAPTTIESDIVEQVEPEKNSTSVPEPRIKPIRQPILPRDEYDGVDSDDESDEEGADQESEEDRPQVVGDIEVDMEEEEDEFLEFSRQALGITDEQWGKIIRDRKDRGVFVPSSAVIGPQTFSRMPANAEKVAISVEKTASGRTPAPGPRPNVNPNLDSFEAVMQAMDAELARSRPNKTKSIPRKPHASDRDKGKAKATIEDEDDIEAAMDAELRATLERDADDDGDNQDGQETLDYNLIKNFLESFKSQGGLSGPVSNLAGRLQPGWKLPRDES